MNTLEYQNIASKVARYYQIDYNLLFDKTRIRDVVRARQMAMHLIMENVKGTSTTITGKFFNKDHATLIHGVRLIKGEIDFYDDRKQEYIDLKHIIFGGFKPKDKYYGRPAKGNCAPCVIHGLITAKKNYEKFVV